MYVCIDEIICHTESECDFRMIVKARLHVYLSCAFVPVQACKHTYVCLHTYTYVCLHAYTYVGLHWSASFVK